MESNIAFQHLVVDSTEILDTKKFIEEFLRPQLPYSLPLLRRSQFHAKHKHQTPGAELWIARSAAPADTWLAAHIDVTNSGQTQVWTFASWEVHFSIVSNPAEAVQLSSQFFIYQKLFDNLFEHIQQKHISKLGDEPSDQWYRLKREGKIVSEPFSRSKILFGTIAECLWPFLDNYGIQGYKKAISREDRPYLKYVATSNRASLQYQEPPHGLHFAPMGEKHLQVIIDRTNIPRTLETLRQLPNIGLFDEDQSPVAWGLIGKDASLSSLHTEPDYRRRGLAELVARRLVSDQIAFFDEDSEAESTIVYTHADVSATNVASRKVMEKIGGQVLWRVAWIEIDLGEQSRSQSTT